MNVDIGVCLCDVVITKVQNTISTMAIQDSDKRLATDALLLQGRVWSAK